MTAANRIATATPGFEMFGGTSAAAPHAAAIAALMLQAAGGPRSLTRAQLLQAMQDTALDIEAPGAWDRDSGAGIVDALAAVGAVPRNPFSGLTPGGAARAVHLTELRTRIDAARRFCGLGAVAWTDRAIVPGITPVKAVHITQPRTALAAAYSGCGRTPPRWTDPSLGRGTTVKAVHFTELRDAVAALALPPAANRAPQATGSIPAQTLTAGGSAARVNVAPYFTDPDGDPLAYTAASGNTGTVTVGVSGSSVTLTPVEGGTATVTVTARDPGGLSAAQPIAVTVTGGGPPPGGACVAGMVLSPGQFCTVDIPGFSFGSNRFEVTSDGRGCYGGSFCAGNSLNLNGFRASRISGTDNWRIDAVP